MGSIFYIGDDPMNYVADCYTKEAYHRCYTHTITPINGQNMSPEVELESLLPPISKRSVRRQKKPRRRELDELTDKATKLRRAYTVNICSKYHQQGHKARGCQIRLNDATPELLTNVYNKMLPTSSL